MRVMDIAREFKVRPLNVYRLVYDLEVFGLISPERKGRNLYLKPADLEVIRDELKKRGYTRGG